MTDTHIAVMPIAHPPASSTEKRSQRRILPKLKAALTAIVWEGQEIADAARAAGMTGHAVRCALDKPHVRAFVKAEREVFREHISSQNIHHARRVRNESKNDMAVIKAAQYIDANEETAATRTGLAQFPGFVIHVSNAPVQQHVAEGVSAKHQAISTTYEAVVEPTHKPPHE